MRKRICSVLLLVIFLLAGCSTGAKNARPTEGESVVKLCAVGDIFPTADMLTDAHKPSVGYDFTSQLSACFPALASADLAIGNFEGNFTAGSFGNGNYPDELADALARAGFDVLQTANSYSIANGVSGLSRTKSVIAQAGMIPLGTFTDAQDQKENQTLLMEVNDIRIAFVSFTKGFGGMGLPENAGHSVNLLYSDYTTNYDEVDTEGILAVLDDARKKDPDIIIAALHWGSENTKDVSRSQEEIASLMFENGVDVILGSHSHIVSTVEQRHIVLKDGTRKDVVLAYGLGDFCAAEAGDCNMTLILNLEFTRNHSTGETKITSLSYTPMAAVDMGKNEQDRYALLDVENELALYENNYYDRIDKSLYDSLLSGMERLKNAVGLN